MTPPSREQLRRYVLVADADLQRALFYRQLFAEQGADAVITRDGQDALHILDRRGPPALLLTDLSLPRLDGLAVIAELRRRASPAETPVLAFSAFEDDTSVSKSWNVIGMSGFGGLPEWMCQTGFDSRCLPSWR